MQLINLLNDIRLIFGLSVSEKKAEGPLLLAVGPVTQTVGQNEVQ